MWFSMHWVCRILAAGTIVAVANSAASAQGLGGPARLLWLERVQNELKLSQEQTARGKDVSKHIQEKYGKEIAKLKDLTGQERSDKAAELRKKMASDADKELAAILKPEQVRRLKQISLQFLGVRAFADAGVQKALKLSGEQKEQMETIGQESGEEIRTLLADARGSNYTEVTKKIMSLRKDAMQKALAVLSDDQKRSWKRLTGKSFELGLEELFNPLKEKGKGIEK
jgi:hypothetical protein